MTVFEARHAHKKERGSCCCDRYFLFIALGRAPFIHVAVLFYKRLWLTYSVSLLH